MKNIYVGNMSYDTDEGGLRAAFEKFGEVSKVSVVSDRETGRRKGFGFVEMPDAEEAAKAIEELNGSNLDGRDIKVNEAKPREDKPRSGGNRDGGRREGGFGGKRREGGFGGNRNGGGRDRGNGGGDRGGRW